MQFYTQTENACMTDRHSHQLPQHLRTCLADVAAVDTSTCVRRTCASLLQRQTGAACVDERCDACLHTIWMHALQCARACACSVHVSRMQSPPRPLHPLPDGLHVLWRAVGGPCKPCSCAARHDCQPGCCCACFNPARSHRTISLATSIQCVSPACAQQSPRHHAPRLRCCDGHIGRLALPPAALAACRGPLRHKKCFLQPHQGAGPAAGADQRAADLAAAHLLPAPPWQVPTTRCPRPQQTWGLPGPPPPAADGGPGIC